jgi:Spherulation-specific family 4/Bacterial Ig domain
VAIEGGATLMNHRWLSTMTSLACGLLVGSAIVTVVVATGAFGLASTGAAVCQQLVVPAYFYPGQYWTEAINSSPVPHAMIMDVSGVGAGSAPDPNYVTAVQQAQARGIDVIGYVDTAYGTRSISAVETEVNNYKAWYNVTDIFFDQAASSSSYLSYYQTISDYVRTRTAGATVILNPGVYPDQSYMGLGDIVLAFEGTYAEYLAASVPSWVTNYPASDFAAVVFAASGTSSMTQALALASERNTANVYVTDNSSSTNPYNDLPSYWTSELSGVAASCTPATGPVVTITAPSNGSTVSGTTQTTSSATDTTKLKTMSLFIDGTLTDTVKGSSLRYSWNVKRVARGAHEIEVTATDAAGNTGQETISVTR